MPLSVAVKLVPPVGFMKSWMVYIFQVHLLYINIPHYPTTSLTLAHSGTSRRTSPQNQTGPGHNREAQNRHAEERNHIRSDPIQ